MRVRAMRRLIKRDVQTRAIVPPMPGADTVGDAADTRAAARTWWRPLRAVVGVAGLMLCGGLLWQSIEPSRLWTALCHASFDRLLWAALLNLTLNLAVRIERWRLLLGRLLVLPAPLHSGAGSLSHARRPQPLSRGQLWRLYLAHLAANNLLPARAGEALRVVLPSRWAGYAVSDLVAVLLVEKAIEVLSMAGLSAGLLALASPPPALAQPLRLTLALGLVLLLLVLSLWAGVARRGQVGAAIGGRVQGFARRLIRALGLLHTLRLWAVALLWSLLSIAADVGMIGLCLSAVGCSLSPLHWLLVFFAINLAIALPVTPGQVGVLEAGAVVALSLLGVGASEGLAFALLYHACHVIPTTLLGGLSLWRLPRGERASGVSQSGGL